MPCEAPCDSNRSRVLPMFDLRELPSGDYCYESAFEDSKLNYEKRNE